MKIVAKKNQESMSMLSSVTLSLSIDTNIHLQKTYSPQNVLFLLDATYFRMFPVSSWLQNNKVKIEYVLSRGIAINIPATSIRSNLDLAYANIQQFSKHAAVFVFKI